MGNSQIKTPDQRLRVFISSTLNELAAERVAARSAVQELKLIPVLFEMGARPHPPQALYRSYLEQSHIFIAVYWQSYGWVAPDMDVSGIEDEYLLAGGKPKLIYVKERSAERDPRLEGLLDRIRSDDSASYKYFDESSELEDLIAEDLALLLTERFDQPEGQEQIERTGQTDEGAVRSNLPAMVNLFVGRHRETAALNRLIMGEAVRITTLTGPGGIGKSRLALEFANSVKDEFPDGVHLVMLQTVQEASLVGASIAKTLNIQGVAGIPIGQVLVDEIGDRRMLLILDNFEHVLEAAGIVTELVSGCPNVVALVTSRSPLNLSGEYEIPVPPLGVPTEAPAWDLESLDDCDAVRLFMDRARSAKPDLEISDYDASDVAEICRKLDGIPLALELAAARIRMLTPEAMLARLTDRFGLLKGGWRDMPDRHRTLRSTIDWSFDLLNDNEKSFFLRAGIFNGGWTLETAEHVCDPDNELDVLELMASLVDKSLFYPYPSKDEPRFSMLETIREYALERLKEGGDYNAVRDRHAELFLRIIARSHPRMRSSEQQGALDQLEDEAGNLRLTLKWLLKTKRAGEAAQASWSLWLFWWLRDRFEEGAALTDQILAADGLNDYERGSAMGAAGSMAFWRGDYGNCMVLLNGAKDQFVKEGYVEGVALCQLALGVVAAALMGPDESTPRFREARAIFDGLGDAWGGALSRNAENWLKLGLETPIPEEELLEAIALAEKSGVDVERAGSHGNYGTQLVRNGRLEEGRQHLHISLRLLAKARVRSLASYALDQVGELCMEEGDASSAGRLFGAADALRQRIGAPLASVHQDHWDGLIARGIELIGEERFTAARAEGAKMAFQTAMREAMARCSRSVSIPATGG
jgi:predicted ATPase